MHPIHLTTLHKILFLSALLVSCTAFRAYALDNFQLWHTETQIFRLSPKTNVLLQETFRFDNSGELYHQEYDLGFLHAVSKSWKFGFNYRHVYSNNKNDDIEEESRPQVLANWKRRFGAFAVGSGNRIEYRNMENRGTSWRYRNRLQLDLPIIAAKLGLRPFLADEIFVDMTNLALVRNRLYAGLSFGSPRITADLYYLNQNSKSNALWTPVNVFGSSIKLAF